MVLSILGWGSLLLAWLLITLVVFDHLARVGRRRHRDLVRRIRRYSLL